jgi:hypothetical protein
MLIRRPGKAIRNDLVRLPQAAALGRQCSRYLRQAHFMTSSEKGVSEPIKRDTHYGSIFVPNTFKNFASHSGCAGQAGAVTKLPST